MCLFYKFHQLDGLHSTKSISTKKQKSKNILNKRKEKQTEIKFMVYNLFFILLLLCVYVSFWNIIRFQLTRNATGIEIIHFYCKQMFFFFCLFSSLHFCDMNDIQRICVGRIFAKTETKKRKKKTKSNRLTNQHNSHTTKRKKKKQKKINPLL